MNDKMYHLKKSFGKHWGHGIRSGKGANGEYPGVGEEGGNSRGLRNVARKA